MSRTIIVLTTDLGLFRSVETELGPSFDCLMCHSMNELATQVEKKDISHLLVHYHPDVVRGVASPRFCEDLQRRASECHLIGLLGVEGSPRNRSVCQDYFDVCMTLPFVPGSLAQVVAEQKDVDQELESFWASMPHRELHGRTRSLVTFTPGMFDMLDEIQVAAKHNVTCLLIGETGCGKTFLARLIHELSDKRDERMCTVACGALPPDLIESELFGYVKGAFTGADRDREGKFAAAGSGTLLLDEIDVLPPEQQAKLLRVIETGEYEPVGSNETKRSEARLIVASNYNLDELVQRGIFRTDLYYRLNILNFKLLPLRERPDDVEFLARRFAIEHGRNHGIRIRKMEREFLDVLQAYPWPGNIREMENVIRRAVLYCKRGTLTTRDLPSSILPSAAELPLAAEDFAQTTPGGQYTSRIEPGMPVLSHGAAFGRPRTLHAGHPHATTHLDSLNPNTLAPQVMAPSDAKLPGSELAHSTRSLEDPRTATKPKSLEARVDLLEC